MKWIECSEKLPPEGKFVLVRHNRGTWISKTDPEGANYVVARLVKGITEKERISLLDEKRKQSYRFGDVFGNNLVPYRWDTFGPDSFFGQTITHWAEFKHISKEEINEKN